MQQSDLIIIGGGIVGLATGVSLSRAVSRQARHRAGKGSAVASHQTGRNSGVLHSGIYYRPGSLKAENCRAGKLAMEEFCREQGIPFELCGKIIVAVDEEELPRLEKLLERGQANGVAASGLGRSGFASSSPHAAGLAAIHIPEAGIVDYAEVARRLAEIDRSAGRAASSHGARRPASAATRTARSSKRRPASSPPSRSSTAPACTAIA